MAALPASIAASELFGHAAGAFTGAAEPHRGHFAQADGGTIFLDEIGAIPLDVQAMLLRVLETMELQPLGSARRVRVDLRVLAATDEDLERSVRDGRFRDALRHRLTGYQVQLPPLRARRDDVGRLLAHFLGVELRALGEERRLAELDKAEPWLPASLVAEACRHHWPGNVRQLANAARRLAVAARGGGRADRATLAPVLGQPPPAPRVEEVVSPGRRPPSRIEEDDLVAALRASGWRIAEAARRLGISRTSLYALIEASSRIRKAGEIPAEEIQACRRECAGDVEAMAGRLETSARGLLLRLRELGIR
jgi:two-component system nitrogen regulation response regulator GlnG